MRLLYLLCVWIHLLAAVVWIGGTTFLTLVLVPVLRKADLGARRAELLHHTGIRFRRVGWIALGTLIGTGILILLLRGVGWTDLTSAAFWASGFGRLLAVKLLVVALLLALSLAHDFVVGPSARPGSCGWTRRPPGPAASGCWRPRWDGRTSSSRSPCWSSPCCWSGGFPRNGRLPESRWW